MARVSIKRGSEGPAHDPYAYTEITFHFTDPKRRPVIYHSGLGEWVNANGKRDVARSRIARSDNDPGARFARLTGMTPEQAERIPLKLLLRRYRAHQRDCGGAIECVDGYPGESLDLCRKCGAVIDSHFDRSAIE